MAKGFNIEVSDRAINNILKKYKTLVNDAAVEIDMELAAHGEDMARSAKNLAPVDTGRLRASISLKKDQFMSYQLVAQTKYAAYHEFGTGTLYEAPEYPEWEDLASKFKGKGIRPVNIPARPFMRPSILAYWPKFKTRVIEVLKMYNERRIK
jgi:phage gpG-like protein